MKLNKRRAKGEEKSVVMQCITWCRRSHQLLAGLPYNDQLMGASGIHLELIVPPGTTREHLEQALREGYRERDVLRHSVVECPLSWFEHAQA